MAVSNYWRQEHQDALVEYITCVTACTSGATRHYLFNNVLYSPLSHMSRQALYTAGVHITDDFVQELLLHLYESVLPKTDTQRAKAFLQYAFTCCKNYAVTNIYLRRKKKNELVVYGEVSPTIEGTMRADSIVSSIDVHIQIVEELDRKIKKEKILNRTNTVYLLLLRQYLIDNNYDPTGFKSYCLRVMKIKPSTFSGLSSRLGIKTKLFNDDTTSII
jgi:hypothetical protein